VTATQPDPHDDPEPEQVDAVMAAARVLVVSTMCEFAAGGELPEANAWSLGWTT
jgi:hypothetical protein